MALTDADRLQMTALALMKYSVVVNTIVGGASSKVAVVIPKTIVSSPTPKVSNTITISKTIYTTGTIYTYANYLLT